jgi:hypothetical protein
LAFGLCLLVACNGDSGSEADLSATALDLAGVDLHVVDSGGIGASCNSACDCQPGLGCLNKACTQGTVDIYCCSSAPCPAGAGCQSADQSYAVCAAGPDGGGVNDGGAGAGDLGVRPRDMGASFCQNVSCASGDLTKCQAFGCSMCVGGQGGMMCAK